MLGAEVYPRRDAFRLHSHISTIKSLGTSLFPTSTLKSLGEIWESRMSRVIRQGVESVRVEFQIAVIEAGVAAISILSSSSWDFSKFETIRSAIWFWKYGACRKSPSAQHLASLFHWPRNHFTFSSASIDVGGASAKPSLFLMFPGCVYAHVRKTAKFLGSVPWVQC